MTDVPVLDEDGLRLQAALGDHYHVTRRLGTGGFGQVFEAWEKLPKRWVAVKFLRTEQHPLARAAERFQREIEVLAAIRHPHVIPIFSINERNGLLFCIMPRIVGGNLAEALERSAPLALAEAIRIACETAGALHAAHELGVVHRDVKPSNIMLDGDARRALLVDFGIARLIDDLGQGLTAPGMVIGSATYVSPEQVLGEPVDHRSDQYSLSLVLFEMLTGSPPFVAPTPEAQMLLRLSESVPLLHSMRPEIPRAIDGVLQKALTRRPADRFESMLQFRDALLAANPVTFTSTAPARELSLWINVEHKTQQLQVPKQNGLLLGRGKDVDVRLLNDDRISREHCRVFWEHSELVVTDLDSKNGTYVNGQKIDKRSLLRAGDELMCGSTRIAIAAQ